MMNLKKSLKTRSLFSYILISIVPILLIVVVILISNYHFYKKTFSEASYVQVTKLTSEINNNVSTIQNIENALITSRDGKEGVMLSICSQEGKDKRISASKWLSNNRKYEYVCENILPTNPYVLGAYLFCENGKVYSYVKNTEFYLEDNYRKTAWYRRISSDDTMEDISIVQPDKRSHYASPMMLFTKKFTDMHARNKGVLVLVCNMDVIQDYGNGTLPWGDSFILNDAGRIIYGKSDELSLSRDQIRYMDSNDVGIVQSVGKTEYIFGKINIDDWHVVSTVSLDSIRRQYYRNTSYILMIVICVIGMISVAMNRMQKSTIQPLIELADIMGRKPGNRLQFRNQYPDRQDEIGLLYHDYEKLINQINELIAEKYEFEIRILSSRLHNLMSQINAHFLFNTLENISCIARLEQNRQIEDMSKSLGDMLHYSINCETDYATLEEEINHVLAYLNIQKIRFGKEVRLTRDLSQTFLSRKVIKFILQPIVENAIEHGMDQNNPSWEIGLQAEQEDGMLVLYLSDNGCGMNSEELEKVQKHINDTAIREEDSHRYNIGLQNINRRIKLLAGEQYGLEIESEEGEGTVVSIKMPWM